MRIQTSPPRWKVQQLKAHRQQNPRNDKPRPHCPEPSALPVFLKAEPAPQTILHDPNDHVRRHVVCVIPFVPFQIHNVRDVHAAAQRGPESQQAFCSCPPPIHTKDPYRSVIESIQHASARSKIVQLFRDHKVSRVKYHAEHPARHAEVRECDVVLSERIGSRNRARKFL